MSSTIYTVGHSTRTTGAFIRLLGLYDVAVLADVRSVPYSRFNPQFNRETLADSVREAGLTYLYLGDALGGLLTGDLANGDRYNGFAAIRRTELFRKGLRTLVQTAAGTPTAVMCAEQDPMTCHRTFLVSEALAHQGICVQHILKTGQLESHQGLMEGLLQRYGLDESAEAGQLFPRPRDERLELALRRHLTP